MNSANTSLRGTVMKAYFTVVSKTETRLAAGENLNVVHNAVLADALEEVQVSKAVYQRAGKRIGFENQEAQNPRNQEEQAGVFVTPALKRCALGRFGAAELIQKPPCHKLLHCVLT